MDFELLIMFAVFLGFSLIVANMSKERDIGFWTLLAISFLLTPIIALIVGLCAKKKLKEGEYIQSPPLETQGGFLSKMFGKKDKKDNNSPPPDNLEMPDFGDASKSK